MSPSTVSVVVVSYNTLEKLRRCLTAIGPDHEVVVVDNASADGSASMVASEFSKATLIANTDNRGFGAANNQGARAATRPLVLYLNSDAYAEEGAIDRLAQVFEDESVIAAGGRLLNPDGSLQLSSANHLTLWAVFCEQLYLEKLFQRSRLFSPYWNTRRLIELPCPADSPQVMGACLMTRRGLEEFDERFFLYCEDTDLCLRLAKRGRIVFVKNASFVHELGSSSAADPVRGVVNYNRGKELYFSIHHGRVAAFTCRVLNRVGALIRCSYWYIRSAMGGGSRAKALARGFWKVAGSS
jgi:N-acetylglucosaminyl-diphospho-decaprenol L-rhamnosyltransferase